MGEKLGSKRQAWRLEQQAESSCLQACMKQTGQLEMVPILKLALSVQVDEPLGDILI